jgi:hypothetical protein
MQMLHRFTKILVSLLTPHNLYIIYNHDWLKVNSKLHLLINTVILDSLSHIYFNLSEIDISL